MLNKAGYTAIPLREHELLTWGFSVFRCSACHCQTPYTYSLSSNHRETTVCFNWVVVSFLYDASSAWNILSLLYPVNSTPFKTQVQMFLPLGSFPWLLLHCSVLPQHKWYPVTLVEVIVLLPHEAEGIPCALLCLQILSKGIKHEGDPVRGFWWLNAGLNEWTWNCSSLIVTEFESQAESCFCR